MTIIGAISFASTGIGLVSGLGVMAFAANMTIASYRYNTGEQDLFDLGMASIPPFFAGLTSLKFAKGFGGIMSRAASRIARWFGRGARSASTFIKKPHLLEGAKFRDVARIFNKSPNWMKDTMRRSTRAKGRVWRELDTRGNMTGRMIQYHPGTPRHFGGKPYWKASSGEGGVQRFPAFWE